MSYQDTNIGHDEEAFGHCKAPEDVLEQMDTMIKDTEGRLSVGVIREKLNKVLREANNEVSITAKDIMNRKGKLGLCRERETKNSLRVFLDDNEFVFHYELPADKISDAFIVLTTPSLLQCLKEFGTTTVMMDSTHDTNAYGLHFTTIQVQRGNGEFLNCVFCLSNRQDQDTWERLFKLILPDGMNTDVLMTDMAFSYHNAWVYCVGAAGQ